jgi:predicted phage terminase large subunit-like protein
MDFNLLLRARPFVAQHLAKDFAAFCRAAWPHLHPGSKLSWTAGHDLVCEHLMRVYRGDCKRLIINTPPRFSKSTIANICFPVWCWLKDPRLSFLCCSYEIDLALNMNFDRRRLMESKWFKDLFADCFQLSTDRAQAGDFGNMQGGQMQAASVNSKAQGRGGDFVVVDDALSADFAYSESFRNETNAWFTNQLPQRLNNPSESAIIVIMQRLHQNDPTGFLLSQEDSEWELLKLPLIAEEDEKITFPISRRVWKRPKGSCLDPKRWSPRTVRERQRDRLTFASQFQQSPMAAEGNLIRTDDILFFAGRDPKTGMMDPGLPESFERKIISVDCSFKDKAGADYVAIIVIGVVGSRRYVLHVTNGRLDLNGTENEIRALRSLFSPVSAVLVEDAANGPSVINHLKDEISGLIAVRPEGGKMARVVATAPEFQSQNWIIERNGPWTHKVIEQLTMFPNAKNDDITDAITQAAIWLQSNTHEYGVLDAFKTGKLQAWLDGVLHREKLPKQAPSPVPTARPQASSRPEEQVWPFCPKCKNVRLVQVGSTPPNDMWCNTCQRGFDRSLNRISEPTPGDVCSNGPYRNAPHDFSQIIANGRKCQHCNEQRSDGPQQAVQMSRQQYDDWKKRR